MKRCFLTTICLAMLVSVCAAQAPNAGEEMQLGKQALSQGKYDDAIQHFEKASNLMPLNVYMQLDLAKTYAQKYVPGVDSPDNVALAEQAIKHYQKVLDIDASRSASLNAAKGIGFIDAQMNKFDESKNSYTKAKELDPTAPDPYYYTAVIDWTLSSQFRQQERARLKLKPEDSLADKDPKVCLVVKEKNASNLAEALDNLNKALELQPIYPDAMTYMSLVYQERADIQCNDPISRKADLKTADDWAKKALLAKQPKGAKQPAPQR